jgi:NADH dehydrogenase [ubiquinone] 1 alpha subcomplex assembly factor 7
VEVSPALREVQRSQLADSGFGLEWHEDFATVPAGPLIAVANELFDALPIRQFERTVRGWCERLVDADRAGGLRWVLSAAASPAAALLPPEVRDAPVGAVAEVCPAGLALAADLATRVVVDGGAALVIDYGAVSFGARETLQAVAGHRPHPPLGMPGKADLCAHVDFAMLARAASEAGARTWGPAPQGAFLGALGIEARATALKAGATATQAADVDSALGRLVGAEGMGSLFQVMAIAHPDLPQPAGLGP